MDTLGQQKARPLQQNIDLSEASLRHVMKGYGGMKSRLASHDGGVMAKPETDALWFYVQQHAMGLVERTLDADEPMGKYAEFVEQYHETIQLKTLRMFYYLLLICTRESRHMKNGDGKKKVYLKHPNIVSFHQNYVQDSSADSAVQAVMDNAPDVTLGEYTTFLVGAFTGPSYSGGFGGKAWASVARPMRDFVHGKISAEIFMDTAFTLAHNNGPIFNKGMLYNTHSGMALIKILDVQRSGQIPQLIANHYDNLNKSIPQLMRDYVEKFSRLDGGFVGKVDWLQVKDIHGKAQYHAEIVLQKAAEPGATWKDKLAKMQALAVEKAAKLKSLAAKAALLKGAIEILPGIFVAKGKRSQA